MTKGLPLSWHSIKYGCGPRKAEKDGPWRLPIGCVCQQIYVSAFWLSSHKMSSSLQHSPDSRITQGRWGTVSHSITMLLRTRILNRNFHINIQPDIQTRDSRCCCQCCCWPNTHIHTGLIALPGPLKSSAITTSHWQYRIKLECGPMPNVMVALPNTGGTLCSTPQSLADARY